MVQTLSDVEDIVDFSGEGEDEAERIFQDDDSSGSEHSGRFSESSLTSGFSLPEMKKFGRVLQKYQKNQSQKYNKSVVWFKKEYFDQIGIISLIYNEGCD